jgi:hypothetical protein
MEKNQDLVRYLLTICGNERSTDPSEQQGRHLVDVRTLRQALPTSRSRALQVIQQSPPLSTLHGLTNADTAAVSDDIEEVTRAATALALIIIATGSETLPVVGADNTVDTAAAAAPAASSAVADPSRSVLSAPGGSSRDARGDDSLEETDEVTWNRGRARLSFYEKQVAIEITKARANQTPPAAAGGASSKSKSTYRWRGNLDEHMGNIGQIYSTLGDRFFVTPWVDLSLDSSFFKALEDGHVYFNRGGAGGKGQKAKAPCAAQDVRRVMIAFAYWARLRLHHKAGGWEINHNNEISRLVVGSLDDD